MAHDETRDRRPDEVRTEARGDAQVVHVSGEIDMATEGVLNAALFEALDTVVTRGADPGLVVVDLSAVTFFASTGVGAVASAFTACREHGVPMRVVARPDTAVHRSLTLMGLAGLVPLLPSLDQALGEPDADDGPGSSASHRSTG